MKSPMLSKYPYGSNLDILWEDDPKMLGIRLSRYKFVSKMLSGFNKVIEVGCGDGWLSKVVEHEVHHLIKTDGNPIEGIAHWNPVDGPYKAPIGVDGVYALDVLEHVDKFQEEAFISNICKTLNKNGVLIIGMPSLELQPFASPKSKESHINCKTEKQLKDLVSKYFNNIFMFGMTDEVVHTGFAPMNCYRIALCVGVK